jgi:hypothetical protein
VDGEAERKYYAAQDARDGKTQGGVACNDAIVQRAKADAAAGDEREHKAGQAWQGGFLDAHTLDQRLYFGRALGVEIESQLRCGVMLSHVLPPFPPTSDCRLE